MVRLLISVTFWVCALIRGRPLLKGGAYYRTTLVWDPALVRGNTFVLMLSFIISLQYFWKFSFFVCSYRCILFARKDFLLTYFKWSKMYLYRMYPVLKWHLNGNFLSKQWKSKEWSQAADFWSFSTLFWIYGSFLSLKSFFFSIFLH